MSYRAIINNDQIAACKPFLYTIYAQNIRAIYIGQTINHYGAIGRLAQHLSISDYATFRKRICSSLKYDEIELTDIYFISVPYSSNQSYHQKSSDHREAVEFLVQTRINNWIIDNNPRLKIVSYVKPNKYCKQVYIEEEASVIYDEIVAWLMELLG